MRMEELSEHRYLKKADSVEAYLLNLVQEYFRRTSDAPLTSMEYIIQKCVERMQEELDYEGLGVMSITLPCDTEPRTGTVTITLEELGGEPKIENKLSAFNVDFGQIQGTACEGNDPRLSDKRDPLPHTHTISDIPGLDGILSTLNGEIQRVDGLMHEHSNKSVLDMLIYTGDRSYIDLGHLESLEEEVNQKLTTVQQAVITYTNNVQAKVTEANQKLLQCQQVAQQVKDFILQKNQEYLQQSKDYTDAQYTVTFNKIKTELNNYVKKIDAQQILDIAKNVYTLAGEMDIDISSKINLMSSEDTARINIDNAIVTEVTTRGQTLAQCQFEYVLYYTYNGKRVHQHLPYVIIDNNDKVDGSLQAGTDVTSKQVVLNFSCFSGDADGSALGTATLKYRVFSKKDVVFT